MAMTVVLLGDMYPDTACFILIIFICQVRTRRWNGREISRMYSVFCVCSYQWAAFGVGIIATGHDLGRTAGPIYLSCLPMSALILEANSDLLSPWRK